MRSRDRILANLETAYREAYERARAEESQKRMEELDWGFLRDQLMMEVLLDVRDLLAGGPAPAAQTTNALERLEALRRLTKLR